MPSQHLLVLLPKKILLELIGQAPNWIIMFTDNRQTESEQVINHPALGHLNFGPGLLVLAARQIRDDPRKGTGNTQFIGIICRDNPIAHIVFHVIFAKAVLIAVTLVCASHLPQTIVDRRQCHKLQSIGQKAKLVLAVDTMVVFEKNQLRTVLTMKNFHTRHSFSWIVPSEINTPSARPICQFITPTQLRTSAVKKGHSNEPIRPDWLPSTLFC